MNRVSEGLHGSVRLVGLSIAIVFLPALAIAEVMYQVQEVPVLPGGNQNFALDINNQGQVVGNSRKGGAGTSLFPYVWTVGSPTPTEIGILPGVPTFGRGFGVNDAGVVVGESGNGPSKAFRWENGDLSDLGSMPGGSGGVANDINNAGLVVGAASNGQSVRAFHTTGGGTLMDLGTPLGTTNSFARAYAVNNAGVVAGVARNAGDTASEPTIWRFGPNGTPIATTISSPRVGAFGEFLALNNAGLFVGRFTNAANQTRAFAYTGTASIDLGLLADEPTFVHSRAQDVNDLGEVVGYVARFDTAPSFGGAAVLWRNGAILDLNDLIDPASGWRLLSAEGINNAGQIVGFGTLGGQTRAFVLTIVPEPPSLVLAGLGLAGVAWGLGLRARRRMTERRILGQSSPRSG